MIESVRPEDLTPALRLLFQHLPPEKQERRLAQAMELIRRGELDPAGVLVVRGEAGLLGVMVCATTPGAGGTVWPPQAAAGSESAAIEDQLVQEALRWLRQRGVKLVQALLAPEEEDLGAPLERNGFRHVTRIWYLRRRLDISPSPLMGEGGGGPPPQGGRGKSAQPSPQLTYQTYADCAAETFKHILLRTYEESWDCPELNDVRTIDEVLEGHRSQGVHDPKKWWLALENGVPVGVLLLTEMPEWDSWDLLYLGLVKEARGRGLGRELTLQALAEARRTGRTHLTVGVDARNRPAWDLYRALGFEPYDRREAFLAVASSR